MKLELSTAYMKLWLGAARQATVNELRIQAIRAYAEQVRETTSDAAVADFAVEVLELTTLRTLEGDLPDPNIPRGIERREKQ